MEDAVIVELYWQRDERALAETQKKYGIFLTRLATGILNNTQDAEECVNDTWQQAWNSIPPERPQYLSAWLGKVARNLCLNRWHKNHAHKRDQGLTQLLGELEDCIPSPALVEDTLDDEALADALTAWLKSLPQDDRVLFLRRYWFGDPLQDLAIESQTDAKKLAQRMFRLRKDLKKHLEKEGITL